MKKRTRTELPEAMIQHIQSFLSGKEASRTRILSKSWYNAWLTRPNLVFDQRDIEGFFFQSEGFSKLVKKTLQRYRDLNLKVDSFKFWMGFKVCLSLANESIVEAIKMGATDITFEIHRTLKFVLPRDVLESETLVRLSLTGCKIEDVNVRCRRLKYLYLGRLYLQGDLFWDIISSCPLIECLELHECKCLIKVDNNILAKKRKILLNLSKQNLAPGVGGLTNLFELHKLRTLVLEKVKTCRLFFSDFSSRFPCLKDLSVHNCSGYKKIQISSRSLEFISFVHGLLILRADFDVPNLRKFCFSGESFWPSLSFPNSCNWESDITISCCHDLSAKWFLNLNSLLTNLSFSKVSLNLFQISYFSNIYKAGNTQCFRRPLVENFTIVLPSEDCAVFFDSLFQCFRPVYVTQYLHPKCSFMDVKYSFIDGKIDIESQEIVYKRLMQQDGVEEVSVGVFDEVVSAWQTVPWKSLLDASSSLIGKQRIRFHLRWG